MEVWFKHKVLNLGGNSAAYWPVHPTSRVVNPARILAGVDTCPGLMPGCYIQAIGTIEIGDYTQIGPSVGIISANHDPYDSRRHVDETVEIGAYCWIGMGAIILPGVQLGDFTVVGAGAVVANSFPEGHCVLGGVPARVLRRLDPTKCVRYEVRSRFHGYLSEREFESLRGRRAET